VIDTADCDYHANPIEFSSRIASNSLKFRVATTSSKMSLSNWQIFTIWMQLGSIRTWSEYFWTWIQVKSLQNQTAFHFSSSPPPTMGEIVELLLECALQVADCSNNHLHKDSMQMELIGAIWYCIRYRKFTFQVYLNSKRPSLHRKVCVLWSGSSSTMNAIT